VEKVFVSFRSIFVLMKGRVRILFLLNANYVTKKGTATDEVRKRGVLFFGIVLPTAILILSPIITIISRLAPILAATKFKKEIDYYKQNSLR